MLSRRRLPCRRILCNIFLSWYNSPCLLIFHGILIFLYIYEINYCFLKFVNKMQRQIRSFIFPIYCYLLYIPKSLKEYVFWSYLYTLKLCQYYKSLCMFPKTRISINFPVILGNLHFCYWYLIKQTLYFQIPIRILQTNWPILFNVLSTECWQNLRIIFNFVCY